MSMKLPTGWRETPQGLLVPPEPPGRMWTPEFEAFMTTLNEHLPEIQGWVSKSLASRAPLTRNDDFMFLSPWQGIRIAQTASGLSADTLRLMADRNPVIAAIIATRCNQCAAFCQLPESRTDVGFRIALRNRERQPTADEKREMREIEDMILECGFAEAEDIRPDITFDQCVRALVRDSLTLDAAVMEIIPGLNRRKYPVIAFQPIDAAQIYLTEPTKYVPRRSRSESVIVAVQMQRGEIVAEYAREDIAYGIRNPSTSQMRQGYGTSELEWLVKIVSCILFGLDYNEAVFTKSAIPPGVLSISGKFSPEMLDAFKREWRAQIEGPGNYWRTPIVATTDGQGVNFVRFRDSNRDMEFHQFLAFLTTVACSVYNIHPEEIGMESWAPQRAALNQPSPVARIEASVDRGLKPLLKMLANQINKKIIWQMYPDRKYIFRWVNIDPADEERELRLAGMRLQQGLTLPRHEIAALDLEQHEYADVPMNTYMFQAWQAAQEKPEEAADEQKADMWQATPWSNPEEESKAQKSLQRIEVIIDDDSAD